MRRLCPAVAAVACVAFLSACGGTPDASPAPTAEPSRPAATSPSPSSPTPVAPTAPPESQRGGARGAEAFVRHYVNVLNYAGLTGDTRTLSNLSTRDCVRCTALIDGINDIYSDGGKIVGGGWTVTTVRPYGWTQQRFFIDILIDSAPQQLVTASGSKEQFDGATDRLRAFVLAPQSRGWKVAELDPTA